MSPIRERSAGVIPFLHEFDSADRPYLLIHSARVRNPLARWEFPKGGIETGESPRQAAAREFVEETGLRSWRFRDGFKWSITCTYARAGLRRTKTVVYFIAEVFDPSTMRRTVEHVEDPAGRWFRWGRFDEVDRLLPHRQMRDAFRAADHWLRSSLQFDGNTNPGNKRA
jgi:bis(5'-nucleosidyl)-tetraphosphatase